MKSSTNGKNASPRPRVPAPPSLPFSTSLCPRVPTSPVPVPLFDTANVAYQLKDRSKTFIFECSGGQKDATLGEKLYFLLFKRIACFDNFAGKLPSVVVDLKMIRVLNDERARANTIKKNSTPVVLAI